jgi:heptosyltransferase-2
VPPRILLVRLSAMGDVILTTPLLRALRRRHPGAEIQYCTRPALAPLVSEHPALDGLVLFEPRDEPLAALARRIRAGRFTHLLDLHGVPRTRLLRLLAPGRWRGYSKRRVARAALIRWKRDLYRDTVPEPERFFEAARGLDVRPDGDPPDFHLAPAARERADGWLARHGLGVERPLVALAPGAAHFTKRWPVDHWEALGARLAALGHDILVVGGPDDVEAGERIARAAGPRARSAAGAFALQETGAALARARAVVAGDTGVMHMATAIRTPVVALFGPTVRRFGFTPYRARAVLLERDLPCRPCSAQGGPACPLGHHRCLRDIPADEVAAAVREFVP